MAGTILKLISPEGNTYNSEYTNNSVKTEFRVQQITYSGVDGTDAIEHGSNGRVWPLSLIFEGEDYLERARKFEDEIKRIAPEEGIGSATNAINSFSNTLKDWMGMRSGRWQLQHPTEGYITNLIPLSVERKIDPVKSILVAEVSVEFLEALPENEISLLKLINMIKKLPVINFLIEGYKTILAIKEAVKTIIEATEAVFGLFDAAVQAIIDTMNAAIDIAETAIELSEAVADGVQRVLMSPLLIRDAAIQGAEEITEEWAEMTESWSTGIKDIIDLYEKTGDRAIDSLPLVTVPNLETVEAGTITPQTKNKSEVMKFTLACINAAMATYIIQAANDPENAGISNRAEAVSIIKKYLEFTDRSIAALEKIEKASDGNLIGAQFFAGDGGANDQNAMRAGVIATIMDTLLNLRVEQKITLEKDRSPLEIAINEMNSSADNVDSNYSALCKRNHFHAYNLTALILRKGTVVKLN